MVEPPQDHPTALDTLALGLSLQLSFPATWLISPPGKMEKLRPGQALLRLAFLASS
jgi:hypothetical protein